jgi:hypothetical protein
MSLRCLLDIQNTMQELGNALASFPSPVHTAEDGGHVDWEGADFAISHICDTLRLMRAEPSLLKCAAGFHDTLNSSVP